MNAIARASLYYSEGNSDKEYHAEIVAIPGGNVVNFRYGRRGGTLTVGSKTAAPVDLAQAQKIFDKLIKEKTTKGYTPDLSGAAYQGTENAGLKTGFTPQLLNPISEAEAMRLIEDDHWAAQEKMDGERRAAYAVAGGVTGMNRKGLSVPLPQAIAGELQHIESKNGAILVDGEMIGDILYVFDLHVYKGERIHRIPWLTRMLLAGEAPCRSHHRWHLRKIRWSEVPDWRLRSSVTTYTLKGIELLGILICQKGRFKLSNDVTEVHANCSPRRSPRPMCKEKGLSISA